MTSKTRPEPVERAYPDYILHACRVARGLTENDPSQDAEIYAMQKSAVLWTVAHAFQIAAAARMAIQFIEDIGGTIVWTPPER